ncbi:MAG: hypothetical protein EA396_00875 [Anaerolineaceae bacterium]|nr:MAG: hypothetical protein EA396_00875 [Anaerolineaceae bacterium]
MTQPPRKPPLLPQEIPPPPPRRFWSRLWRPVMSVFGLLWLVAAIALLVLVQSGVIGITTPANATQTAAAFGATVDAINQTAIALGDREFQIENTSAALDAQNFLIDQRETESARNFSATETRSAVVNAQQATAAALDFQGTQIAFAQEATRIELNYRGTQAALNQNATAAALGFATQAQPAPEDDISPTPTDDRRPLFAENFAGGISGATWRPGSADDWLLGDGAISARRDGAWLLTQVNTLTDYTLQLDMRPVADTGADYFVAVNAPMAGDGFVLRLTYNGTRISAAGLYEVNTASWLAGDSQLGRALTAVQLPDSPPTAFFPLVVTVRGTTFTATLDDDFTLLNATLDAPLSAGAVGVRVPQGTTLSRVTVTTD